MVTELCIAIGTRLIHNVRGAGRVVFLMNNLDTDAKMMVVEFDDSRKTGKFDRESENFVYEETGSPIKPPTNDPPKSISAKDRWKNQGHYWPYAGHEEFFESTNFTKSLAVNPQECWWFVGYWQTCGGDIFHEPVREANAAVQRRGPTRHNYFPDPCKMALDQKVGEFFDFYSTGRVQINSVALFDFLNSDPSPVAPPEYQKSYQEGRAAGEKAEKQNDETLPQF